MDLTDRDWDSIPFKPSLSAFTGRAVVLPTAARRFTKSYMDMASKLFTFTFTFTQGITPQVASRKAIITHKSKGCQGIGPEDFRTKRPAHLDECTSHAIRIPSDEATCCIFACIGTSTGLYGTGFPRSSGRMYDYFGFPSYAYGTCSMQKVVRIRHRWTVVCGHRSHRFLYESSTVTSHARITHSTSLYRHLAK